MIDLHDIRMVEQVGGTVDDTELIAQGLVLTKGASKTASNAVSRIDANAKIALLQYCLTAPKTFRIVMIIGYRSYWVGEYDIQVL